MLKHIKLTMLAIAAICCLTACSGNDPDDDSNLYIDIATFVAQGDNGSVFELQRYADSPMITYTSTRKLSERTFPIGCRLLLAYRTIDGAEPYQSGPIDLASVGVVVNGKVTEGNTDDVRTYPMVLRSLSRTGTWVNVECNLAYRYRYEKFSLMVDKATLSKPMPKLYLTYVPDSENDMDWNTTVASFDIASVWDLPTCQGITIEVLTTSGVQTIDLKKSDNNIN